MSSNAVLQASIMTKPQIQIYDSLQGKKVPFDKKPGEKISMYVCGPTVYDSGHLGHGRSAVAFDLIRRFFEFAGYEVDFVFNTTDIEDKIIKRANEEGVTSEELIEKVIPEYERDYKALGIKEPTHSPKATEFIEEMVALITKLEEKGCTYALEDGLYFDITKFPEYGKLSHQKLDELEAGARVEERKDKRNHQDFVLWKLKKEGEPAWPSPWGEGRPGWHIECSAMSQKLLGETIDIHGGGLDLKFPHHECEIAQSESASGKQFARYWMHNGYITTNKEKMSKSLGNFFTLKDIFKKYDPRVVRFFLLSTHYRSPIEHSDESLEQARQTLKTLDDFYLKSKNLTCKSRTSTESTGKKPSNANEDFLQKVTEKMSNDFDVAGTLALIFEWMNTNPKNALGTLEKLNKFLGVFPTDFIVTPEQEKLIQERQSARQEKNWLLSDSLRDQLADQKIEVEDTPDGPFAKPKI
jgi:cysteinyl-tRNA synthetase